MEAFVRRLWAVIYRWAPLFVFGALRPLFLRRPSGPSSFLERFSTPYEDAMDQMGTAHWQEKIDRLRLNVKGDVLDVGCGPGQWLSLLTKDNRTAIGVERDAALLEIARRRCAENRRVRLVRAVAEALPIAAGSVDVVLCYNVLAYTDSNAFVKEAFRVLRPGGTTVIGLAGPGYYLKHVTEGVRYRRLDAVRYGLTPFLTRLAEMLSGRSSGISTWTSHRLYRLMQNGGFVVREIGGDRLHPSWPATYLGTYFAFWIAASKPAEPARLRH